MKKTYVWHDGWVEKKQTIRPAGPYVMPDIPEYVSPLGTGVVGSRSHRREELKRHNCREVDPGEFKPEFLSVNEKRRVAEEQRAQLTAREAEAKKYG